MESSKIDTVPDFPEIIDDFYPVGGRLSAKYKKAVGYDVLVNRLPRILESAIDLAVADSDRFEHAASEHKKVVENLRQLLHELRTNTLISEVKSPVWNAYKEKVIADFFAGDASKDTWLAGPFLRNETYMYHRIHEILDSSTIYQNYDIFRPLKEKAFLSSLNPMTSTLEWMASSDLKSPQVLQSLLEISIWGNRCDMALNPGEDESQKSNIVLQLEDLKSNFVSNDSEHFWAHLRASRAAGPVDVAYVTDNAGFEFFGDLCLTSALLQIGLVDSVTFYVKKQGLCISDVMVHDLHWMIRSLAASETSTMKNFGNLLQGFLNQGQFRVVEHPFWTYPYTYDEMKSADPDLYAELAKHQLVVVKGDLSYRRLIGDLNWPLDTPFEVALQSFHPAPLLSLRTIKVDVGVGLCQSAIKRSEEQGRGWMLTGEFATIQFCSKID